MIPIKSSEVYRALAKFCRMCCNVFKSNSDLTLRIQSWLLNKWSTLSCLRYGGAKRGDRTMVRYIGNSIVMLFVNKMCNSSGVGLLSKATNITPDPDSPIQ